MAVICILSCRELDDPPRPPFRRPPASGLWPRLPVRREVRDRLEGVRAGKLTEAVAELRTM
jgi:hypothetical protein